MAVRGVDEDGRRPGRAGTCVNQGSERHVIEAAQEAWVPWYEASSEIVGRCVSHADECCGADQVPHRGGVGT